MNSLRAISLILLLLACLQPFGRAAEELRGFWVDAFHNGYKSAAQVTQLVADARAGNFNALFVQVRKRGDAYYTGGLEPRATDITGATFDPLQDLINKAHSGTPRIEVHAWIVTYNIWNQQSVVPTQPTHPYLLHPDWLTQKADGTKWDGSNYAFDPGLPAVQEHTYNVCMDIVQRYEIDGLHFDYVRYTDSESSVGSQAYGYHPQSVQRFQRLYARTDTPAANDSQWLQFRRDQVTALVRKVYLKAWQARRAARISAALICYGAAPADQSASAWQGRDAYGRVLQDWRSWLQEGILDLGVPMIYRDYANSSRATEWTNWCAYGRDNQGGRAVAAGAGIYLNAIAGTISEIKISRLPGSGGRTLAGVVGYSYATFSKDVPLPSTATFLNALTDPTAAATYDPGGTPVFNVPSTIPAMPWKTSSTTGHVMGYVRNEPGTVNFDGVVISLSGPASRILKSDATGFFGAVDLPVGQYWATVNLPGYYAASQLITVQAAQVSEWTAALVELPFAITASTWYPIPRQIALTWNSKPLETYRVEGSSDLVTWIPLVVGYPATGYSTSWTSAAQPLSMGKQFFRVKLEN